MLELQREGFVDDEVSGGEYGIIQVGAQRFKGRICGRQEQDKAWVVAARVFAFLELRFAEIEKRVSKVLVPISGIDRHLEVEPEEAVRQIIEAMRGTKSPQFVIYDVGYSTVSFDAIAGRSDLCIEALFAEDGELLTLRF